MRNKNYSFLTYIKEGFGTLQFTAFLILYSTGMGYTISACIKGEDGHLGALVLMTFLSIAFLLMFTIFYYKAKEEFNNSNKEK